VVDMAALQCRTCIEHRLRRIHEPEADVAAVARGLHDYLFLQYFMFDVYSSATRGASAHKAESSLYSDRVLPRIT
jgi:hypothetical protein